MACEISLLVHGLLHVPLYNNYLLFIVTFCGEGCAVYFLRQLILVFYPNLGPKWNSVSLLRFTTSMLACFFFFLRLRKS